MKYITCCLSILSGLLLQSCDITRMETPAYKTDRASTRTYENLIFYEVLTDGQQYDAARLSLIASNIRKNTDVKYTALFIEYKEYGSAPSYAATSMNGDSVVTRLKSGEETRNGQETDAPPADSSVDSLNEPEQKTETADRRKQPSDSDDKTVLGRFRDQFSSVYTVYEQGGRHYLDNAFADGSHSLQELEVRTRNGAKTYHAADSPDEFYVIRNGKFYCYDLEGNLGVVYDPY